MRLGQECDLDFFSDPGTRQINPTKVIRVPANAFYEFGHNLLLLSQYSPSPPCLFRYSSSGFFHFSLLFIDPFTVFFAFAFGSMRVAVLAIYILYASRIFISLLHT